MARKKEKKVEHEDETTHHLHAHTKRTIAAILLFLIALLFVLGFFHSAGIAGEKMTGLIGMIFGWGKYIAPLFFVFAGVILLRKKVETRFYVTKIIGVSLAFWGILGLFHLLPFESEQFVLMAKEGVGGGFLGYLLAKPLAMFTGKIAGTLILIALVVVGFIVAFNVSLVGVNVIKNRKKETEDVEDGEEDDEDDEDEEYVEEEDENVIANKAEEDEFDDADDFDDVADNLSVPLAQDIPSKPAIKSQEPIESSMDNDGQRPQISNTEWKLPPLKLLKKGGSKAKGGDVKQNALRIQETFKNFGIDMELENIVTGPTVTQYSFRPQSGIKLTRITALNADLALALAAHPIRIEAPIPGKSLVGIEVPNRETATVRMRSLLSANKFSKNSNKLLLALGEDVNGNYVYEDLAKMPHLLVAGTTGAGKSVAVNSILLSLLFKNSPDDLKLILVDPKRVELSLYQGIPHLLSDVIVNNEKVVNALKWAVSEMDRRYRLLQETGSKNLESYNQKKLNGEKRTYTDPETGQPVVEDMVNLPVIVIVIDELSDLMSSHGKEVEGVIVRLAQMSRAVGIHLILSTQRPSVEVITGLIKANMPTRIALKVNSNIDSRTILDTTGAENLIGNGDMLFSGPNTSTPVRLQNPYVSEEEIVKVVNFIKQQAESMGAYDMGEDFDDAGGQSAGTNVDFGEPPAEEGASSESEDPIYEEAKQLVIEAGKASTSYIQRRLRIGYSRAARLMDELEENGVIGPPEGSKPRKVLVDQNTDNEE